MTTFLDKAHRVRLNTFEWSKRERRALLHVILLIKHKGVKP